MKRYEAIETLFSKIDLTLAEKILNEPYHPPGSRGRPQRNPVGIFKAHIVKRVKHIPSDRMLVRQMWKDPRLKKICDIEADQQPCYNVTNEFDRSFDCLHLIPVAAYFHRKPCVNF